MILLKTKEKRREEKEHEHATLKKATIIIIIIITVVVLVRIINKQIKIIRRTIKIFFLKKRRNHEISDLEVSLS